MPHRIVFSGGWDLPFDEFVSSAPKFLTRGWSVYPIVYYQSGYPLDVYDTRLSRSRADPGPTGASDQELVRATLVAPIQKFNPYASVGAGNGAPYFSPGSFNLNVTSGYGTLSRNHFSGPGRTNVDMSLAKATPLTRGDHPLNFELRGLLQPVQHDAVSSPNTNFDNRQFGEITTVYPESWRIIQLAGNLRF